MVGNLDVEFKEHISFSIIEFLLNLYLLYDFTDDEFVALKAI